MSRSCSDYQLIKERNYDDFHQSIVEPLYCLNHFNARVDSLLLFLLLLYFCFCVLFSVIYSVSQTIVRCLSGYCGGAIDLIITIFTQLHRSAFNLEFETVLESIVNLIHGC